MWEGELPLSEIIIASFQPCFPSAPDRGAQSVDRGAGAGAVRM